MCWERNTNLYQLRDSYNNRDEAAWRDQAEYANVLKAEKKERFRQVTGELGHALKWMAGVGA